MATELVRYGGSELHSIASVMRGRGIMEEEEEGEQEEEGGGEAGGSGICDGNGEVGVRRRMEGRRGRERWGQVRSILKEEQVVGGIGANEVCKVLMKQFVPACGSFLYNGVTGKNALCVF